MEHTFTFGFIGCGNMGGALAEAAAKGNPAMKIAVCDAFTEKAEKLAQKYPCVTAVKLTNIVLDSQYVFIGVKPQMLEQLFADIRPLLEQRDDIILVSMAAGTPIQKLTSLAGKELPVIRIMPNTPVSIGKGMVLYCANLLVKEDELSFFVNAMSGVGILDEIDENKIDAASAVSGCGPAFVYIFMEALADGGVECGLPRDKAMKYAAATVAGSAEMLLTSGRHPGELKDAVCSPGGTTIAGVHALEKDGFRAAAMDAVTAAYIKTLGLK